MASICPVCGGKLGLLNREKSADGLICATCSNFFYSKLGFRAAKQPAAALADYWATLEQRRKVFKETDSIYDGDALFVSIDKINRLFCFGHRGGDKGPRMIYSFDEVAGYESDSPDDLTVTETKGGIGRAVIGAAIAGPVGAIVGASTAKTETRKGRSKENVSINFVLPLGESSLPTTVYPGGMTTFLKSCKDSQEKPQATAPAASSTADELLKFKRLLDMGAITEAEYNAKKAQLLGL
nr:MAG TPA: Short C-terminal domain [Caudoviricetes sp.]